MKGFNSILFDFYSLVDMKLSVIEFIKGEYRDVDLPSLDKHKILYTSKDSWLFQRQFGAEDLFKSIIVNEEYKPKYNEFFNAIIRENEEEIISKYAFSTDVGILINGYRRAGDGTISTVIQCDKEFQKKYIEKKFPGVAIEYGPREKIDMSKYARLIVGDVENAIKYSLEEPKSILVLNYRENFTDKDSTLLKPELIINFGDIHDIGVISAYRPSDMKGE